MADFKSSITTRRDAFAALGTTGLAALSLAGFARPETLATPPRTAPAGADQRLLELVAELQATTARHDRLSAAWGDVIHVPDSIDAELAEITDQEDVLRDQISALPATTAAGAAAKCRLAIWSLNTFTHPDDIDSHDRLLFSLLADVLRHDAPQVAA